MSRVLISMPDKFLEDIDKVAQAESRSRSELIREAVRSYVKSNSINYNNKELTALKGATNPLKL